MAYTIRQNLTNVNYTPRGSAPGWIVIHNTANGTSAEGTAYANTNYFKNVDRNASATYFVDDGDVVWQCVRDTDTAWHCGEAASRNGCYNSNSIGIEVCERADGSFSEHEINVLAWLVPMLMNRYGIPPGHICRHHDVTGKICPAGYIDDSRWQALKQRIVSGEQEDEVTPEDKKEIARMVCDEMMAKLPDRTAEAVVWKHFTVDGKPGWTLGGAVKNLVHDIWNEDIGGTRARDRLFGIDAAANAAKTLSEKIIKLLSK